MRELAVQSANGTNNDEDRLAIQAEIDQLNEEITRIGNTTEFNTKKLLNGNIDRKSYSSDNTVELISMSDTVPVGVYSIEITAIARKAQVTTQSASTVAGPLPDPVTVAVLDGKVTKAGSGKLFVNGEELEIKEGDDADAVFEKIRNLCDKVNVTLTATETNGDSALFDWGKNLVFTNDEYGSSKVVELHADGGVMDLLGLSASKNTTDPTIIPAPGAWDVTAAGANIKGLDAEVNLILNKNDPNSLFKETSTVSSDGTIVRISDKNGFEIRFDIGEEFSLNPNPLNDFLTVCKGIFDGGGTLVPTDLATLLATDIDSIDDFADFGVLKTTITGMVVPALPPKGDGEIYPADETVAHMYIEDAIYNESYKAKETLRDLLNTYKDGGSPQKGLADHLNTAFTVLDLTDPTSVSTFITAVMGVPGANPPVNSGAFDIDDIAKVVPDVLKAADDTLKNTIAQVKTDLAKVFDGGVSTPLDLATILQPMLKGFDLTDTVAVDNLKNTINGMRTTPPIGANQIIDADADKAIAALEAAVAKAQIIGTSNNVSVALLSSGPMVLQIGANQYQTMDVRIPELTPKTLGIDKVNLTTSDGSQEALTMIDNAINTVSSIRSKLGAYYNRLEHSINNLEIGSENLTEALSRISDADMAKEMATYTQRNVLAQAGTSMLAQANQRPQTILQLLQ